MAKKIIGFIAGYIAMAIFLFVTFTILYMILGADGSFKPSSFHISTTWAVFSIILTFLGAIDGGLVCMLIAKHKGTVLVLAAFVLIVGISSAIPKISTTAVGSDQIRVGYVSNIQAMRNAIQPISVLLINPVISAVGIFLGGSLIKSRKKEDAA